MPRVGLANSSPDWNGAIWSSGVRGARADGWRTPGGIERCGSGYACSRASWAAVYDNARRLLVLLWYTALRRSNTRRGWRVFRWRITVGASRGREGVGRRGAHPLGVRSCR